MSNVIDLSDRRRRIPPGPWNTRQLDSPFKTGFPRCEALTRAGERCRHAARTQVGERVVCLTHVAPSGEEHRHDRAKVVVAVARRPA